MTTPTLPDGTDPETLVLNAIAKAQELIGQGRPDMARDIAKQVLRCQPENPDALELMGLAHHQKRDYKVATKYLRSAAELQPDNADFLNNLALPLSMLGEVDEAISLLIRAKNLSPANPRFLSNLALQYRCAGRTDEAISTFNESIALRPLATTYVNLGGTLGESHRLQEATSAFRKAIEIEPENAMAHTDLAYSLHLQGDWEEAWGEYEWRLKSFPQLRPYLEKYDQNLRWDGSPLTSEDRVMIFCEQGFGDTLQFVRYIPVLKEKYGCHVIVHCSADLVPLLKQSDLGIDEYFTVPVVQMTSVTPHDFHLCSLSLPFMLKQSCVGSEPYLKSESHAMGYADKRRYGISWAGSPLHPNDRHRSCRLSLFKEIHDLPDVKLFALCDPRGRQYGEGTPVIDLAEGCDDMKVVDCWSHMTDFAKSAAIVKGLTGVITVDTALMHLAGALGVPTIGLLAYNPDWRWGLDDDHTPWYPSLTLIRQPRPGDWTSVFAQLKDLLEARTCATSSQ